MEMNESGKCENEKTKTAGLRLFRVSKLTTSSYIRWCERSADYAEKACERGDTAFELYPLAYIFHLKT